ncbi:hypothetical protein PEX1_105230 [Penicillium expansum]|uniref:Uncharacterized protein n=1 Tax=Penicillium expansum TaxID=27334 RepID=A0A0A2JI86_PENEN|nr:hypothetical protein PEX2_064820 [Penicillium expansum]KGO45725.1 hypothetical protein PEX1_105230 [Penicillium expansum]KGO47692.1 hypothetical protein PEXP_013410 [Penicillium expansum]KGO52020.1 hypothetical protein PEX2_064820 [Penicillium expansum]
MGKTNSALNAFITGIPDDKLSGFKDIIYALYKDTNFTLVHEGPTTSYPQCHDIYIQANIDSALKKEAKINVAKALVPTDGLWSPQQIRQALLSSSAR